MHIFFGGSESLLRTFVITVLAYVLLIVLLRGSGKRTLSKMNAFDFIVTIALGSTLATVMLNKSIPLAHGVLAFFLLIYLHYIITYLSVRSTFINRLIERIPSGLAPGPTKLKLFLSFDKWQKLYQSLAT